MTLELPAHPDSRVNFLLRAAVEIPNPSAEFVEALLDAITPMQPRNPAVLAFDAIRTSLQNAEQADSNRECDYWLDEALWYARRLIEAENRAALRLAPVTA